MSSKVIKKNTETSTKDDSIPMSATNAADNDELITCVTTNLKNLINTYGINQKQLSEKTGYSEAAVCKYFGGKMLPPIDFFLKLQQLFNISIDDFISGPMVELAPNTDPYKELREAEEFELAKKYCGNYVVYYLDTSNYKGRDSNSPCQSLVYGVISIIQVKSYGKPKFESVAVLGMTNRETAYNLKDNLDSCSTFQEIMSYIDTNTTSNNIYRGAFEFGAKHAYITLKHGNIDRAMIILYRVETNKPEFNGGLGVINSGSKGREKMPTAQFMGFSRVPLSLSDEEIHHELLLTYPTLKADKEIKELVSFFKNTYLSDNSSNAYYTEYQKELMLKTTIEYSIKKIIERNMDRYAKASERDDHNWYKLVKHEKERQQQSFADLL